MCSKNKWLDEHPEYAHESTDTGKASQLVLKKEDLDWENKVLVGKDWSEDAYDVGEAIVESLALQGKGRFTKLKCQLVKVVPVSYTHLTLPTILLV